MQLLQQPRFVEQEEKKPQYFNDVELMLAAHALTAPHLVPPRHRAETEDMLHELGMRNCPVKNNVILELLRRSSSDVDASSFRIQQFLRFGIQLVYSFGVPTEEAIDTLVRHSPLVEVGAGRGFWASQIRRCGGDIICYEHDRLKQEFSAVISGDPNMSEVHPDRALFLCWPDVGDTAFHTLTRFAGAGGRKFLFVGDRLGCANEQFFDELEERWQLLESVPLPRINEISDSLLVWQRR